MAEHRIPVLLFAALREAAGRDRVEISLPPDATTETVRAAVAAAVPALAPLVGRCRIAADQAFVDEGACVGRPAELALIPPVSGGHDGPRRAELTFEPIDPQAVADRVASDACGAIVTFTGQVRDHARGQSVVRLEYEAYVPMARSVLERIAADVEGALPGTRVAIVHRLGTLQVGEIAVVVAVAAAHRAEAFDGCRRAIEALKADAPIWKKEFAASGAVWVGMGP
ncbi:MAG: molybdenum cofactor biosynthesis protein MoaE [Deltaproteobacteria bacterium]|nr:MAG: molybdenum cofactor biosynthesis protein MoaE [Deltaproteobacteria bacterium]